MMIENELMKSENKLEMCLEHNIFVASLPVWAAQRLLLTVVITSVVY
jgi:hypothetical protein